MNELDRVMLT